LTAPTPPGQFIYDTTESGHGNRDSLAAVAVELKFLGGVQDVA